ncbi:hypothetical protein BDR04DRAFT_1104186, partial [Suillus decipiens]
ICLVFFILRTYVLWKNNRIILVAVLSVFFAVLVSSISMMTVSDAESDVVTSTIPGIPGCSLSWQGSKLFVPFILVFVFQLGLVCLTMICVIRSWRSAKGSLYVMLVKHNIFYYACGLRESGLRYVSALISDDNCLKSFLGRERSSSIITFGYLYSCNPRHTHAPSSLA